jgi:HEAT repeat protein
VTLLGQNKVQRATPDLVPLASDPDVSVRRALVLTLMQMADIRSLPGFVTLTSDPERDIRDKAIEGLTNLYLPQESGLVVTINRVANFFNPWSDEWAEILVEPDLTVDASAIAALTSRLQDGDEAIRVKTARSLGILRGRSATPSLLAAIREDRSDAVRFEAVRALRKIADPTVGADLLPLLPINEPKVRYEIVYTLGRLRYAESVPELTRRLETELAAAERDQDHVNVVQLLGALAFIGHPDSKPVFMRLRDSEDADMRRMAYEGLGRVPLQALPPEVTDAAAARLAEKETRVRLAQDFALYRMGRPEHLNEVILGLGARRSYTQAREYLLDFRGAEVHNLYMHTANNDVNIREALAEILGLVGDESSLPSLRELLRDTRGQVSAFAGQAIRRIEARKGPGSA